MLHKNFTVFDLKNIDYEIKARRKEWKYAGKQVNSRWLRQYQKLVTNASNGAILEA